MMRVRWWIVGWMAAWGLAAGGVAAAAEEVNAVALAAASIRADDLAKHVEVLASDAFEGRAAGSRGGRAAAGYITDALERTALLPAGEGGGYFQMFGGGMRNILAVLEGGDASLREQYVVIGAHYDHVGYGTPRNSYGPTGLIHNGADDNASGVATLLEVAEALSRLPDPPARSIVLAFWDGEEDGLLGSKHWTSRPTLPLAQVSSAVNVDMVGRLRGKLEVFGTRSGHGWRNLVVRQNAWTRIPLAFPWKMQADSDHYSFVERNIPVVMFHTGLHDEYHRPSDDSHLINTGGMQDIGRLLFHVAVQLANDPTPPGFRSAVFQEHDGVKEQFERVQWTSPPPRLGVRWKAAPDGGLELTEVAAESAAAAAGLNAGDVVLQWNGRPVGEDFAAQVWAADADNRLLLRRAAEAGPVMVPIRLAGPPVRLGVSWRRDQGNPHAMWISQVIPGTAADAAGLRAGDRVLAVNGRPATDDASFRREIEGAGEHEFLVDRDGVLQPLRVTLR